MKRINFHPYLLITLLAFLAAWLTSCSTPEKLVNKAYKKDPVYVADWTRGKFPCVTTSADTTYKVDTLYDIMELPCPEYLWLPEDSLKIHAKTPENTVVNKPLRTGRTIPTKFSVPRPVQTVYIERKIEDSAKIFMLTADFKRQINTLSDAVAKCDNKNKELTSDLKNWKKISLWLLILLIASLIFIYLSRRKR